MAAKLASMRRAIKQALLALSGQGTVIRVDTRQPLIALTFDDGPSPEFTPQLLDILERHRARATFFVVGETASRYPELVAETTARGHTVGNHSWDHPSFPTLTGRQRRRQMRRCAEALAPFGAPLFRPPFGHQSPASRLDAWLAGYEVIAWTALAGDWHDWDADRIVQELAGQLLPGHIILLHDALFSAENAACLDRRPTLEAVERLLTEHPDYAFVTIPALLRSGRAVRQAWYKRGDPAWLDRLKTAKKLYDQTDNGKF